jgi:DnaJ-class molecular chaperone
MEQCCRCCGSWNIFDHRCGQCGTLTPEGVRERNDEIRQRQQYEKEIEKIRNANIRKAQIKEILRQRAINNEMEDRLFTSRNRSPFTSDYTNHEDTYSNSSDDSYTSDNHTCVHCRGTGKWIMGPYGLYQFIVNITCRVCGGRGKI